MMERYSSKNGQTNGRSTAAAKNAASQESFSEMANVTASKSGVVGKLLVISLIIVSVAVTAFVGFAIVQGVDSQSDAVKTDQYQAVFLTDGQIYFGKLADLDQDWAVLSDIYYLQVNQQVQPVTEDGAEDQQAQISLAKLGNELHGPEDQMFINPANILFWENLKGDGQVVTAITEFQTNGAPAEETQ